MPQTPKETNEFKKNESCENALRNDTKWKPFYLAGISRVLTILESAVSSRASLPVCAQLYFARWLFLSSKQSDLRHSWHFVAKQSSSPITWSISALYLPCCIDTDAELTRCPASQKVSSFWCIPWLICIQQMMPCFRKGYLS